MNILAIDPGNVKSGWVVMNANTFSPLMFDKSENDNLMTCLDNICDKYKIKSAVIEMIACYGMAVGKSVFDTCIWIGRFTEHLESIGISVKYILRKDEKINLCGTMKAKDSNIRRALIDRFAKLDFRNGKGTKNNPDWFYGFKADIWAAYAVGVTWIDQKRNEKKSEVENE